MLVIPVPWRPQKVCILIMFPIIFQSILSSLIFLILVWPVTLMDLQIIYLLRMFHLIFQLIHATLAIVLLGTSVILTNSQNVCLLIMFPWKFQLIRATLNLVTFMRSDTLTNPTLTKSQKGCFLRTLNAPCNILVDLYYPNPCNVSVTLMRSVTLSN